MKRFFPICVVLGLLNVTAADLYVETFESDPGWHTVTFDPTLNPSVALEFDPSTWDSTGGNPDGHIYGSVGTNTTRLYALLPDDVGPYGDMTGLTLTTDFRIGETETVTNPDGYPMARFYIGTYTEGYDYYVSNDTFSWNPNDDTSWTTHQVPLVADNFSHWPNEIEVDKTFEDIVAAPEAIGIVFVGDFTDPKSFGVMSSGGATIRIDNFGVTPVPGAVVLGLIGLGVAGWKLRRFS